MHNLFRSRNARLWRYLRPNCTTSKIPEFDEMTINELKVFLKQAGGHWISGSRKKNLVEECRRLYSMSSAVIAKNLDLTSEVTAQKYPSVTTTDTIQTFSPASKSFEHVVMSGSQPKTDSLCKLHRTNRSILRKMPIFPDHNRTKTEDSDNSLNSKSQPFQRTQYQFPTGNTRNNRLLNLGSSDMDILFLGTASCVPSISRGVSCAGFRHDAGMWLFDCGESSQLQLQKSHMKPSKIKKIFISHTHGDHCFGLPGVLCMMGQAGVQKDVPDWSAEIDPIDIYGPEGIRDLIRAVLQLTHSKIAVSHRIHELKNVSVYNSTAWKHQFKTAFSPHHGEVSGGTDIFPDDHGNYLVCEDAQLTVHAAPMKHTVPCVGFVIHEKTRPGRLKAEWVQPIVTRNLPQLRDVLKDDPMTVMKILKQLQPGQTFTMPDGTTLRAEDLMEAPQPGRKVVFMGDTCSGDHIAELARDADVLVHEATNAFHPFVSKHKNYRELEYDTIKHGHSTPQMAGRFCKRVGAKKLILTHFSPRYTGDGSESSMRVMWGIEDMARSTADLWGPNDVIAAWDHMLLPVNRYVPAVPAASA